MPKVGGEVDAPCTRCGLVLAHTVIAMLGAKPVKVECNTCHGVHRYRAPPAGAKGRPTASKARATRAPKATISFDDLLAKKKRAPVPYSARQSFTVDDVLDHPVFGRGFVSDVRDASKIEVTFRSDVKVLVHGRP